MPRIATLDYEHMLDLAVSVLNSTESASAWQLIAEELVRGLHGTAGVFSEVHRTSGFARVHARTPASLGALPLESVLRGQIKSGHPMVHHYATTSDRNPLAITDIMSETQWQRTEAYALTRRTLDSRYHFAVPLPAETDSVRCFVIHRDSTRFTDHERVYARRIQPLLVSVDAHFRRLSQWQARSLSSTFTPVEAATAHGLSPRETAVLSLVAETYTAEAIGRRLGITTRTVHKHLENLYRKLGTSDRLATVLRAHHLGLLTVTAQHDRRSR